MLLHKTSWIIDIIAKEVIYYNFEVKDEVSGVYQIVKCM